MRKGIRLIKSCIAIVLAMLLSINSFAAIVSDNDGSAFITKAEFDSLKNDFQSQIDQYNTSIDSKIDGAIAAYLSGIKIDTTTTLTDMITAARANSVNNVTFAKWKTPQATKDTYDVQAGFVIASSWGSGGTNNGTSGKTYGNIIFNNGAAWGGGIQIQRYTNFTGNTADYTSAYYFAKFPFGIGDDDNYVTTGDTQNWSLANVNRWRYSLDLRAQRITFLGAAQDYALTSLTRPPASITVDFSAASRPSRNQPATFAGDNISFGAVSYQPYCSIVHSFSRTAASDTTTNAFLNYNISGTIPSTTTKCVDYDYRNNYYASQTATLTIQSTKAASTAVGGNAGSSLSLSNNGTNWQTANSQTSNLSNNHNFIWKYNYAKIYELNWQKLTNNYYNQIMQKPWFKYYGIPLCKTPTKKGSLKLTINVAHSSGNGAVVRIMDKPFPNGAMPTTDKEGGIDHVLWKSGPATYQNSTWKNQVIQKEKIWDTTNGDYLYIKVEPANDTQVVTVSITGDIVYTEDNS